jgi:hypothetical protein
MGALSVWSNSNSHRLQPLPHTPGLILETLAGISLDRRHFEDFQERESLKTRIDATARK